MNAADLALFQEFLAFKARGGSVAPEAPRLAFNPKRAIENIFTKMNPNRQAQHENVALFYTLRHIYSLQPEAFELLNDGNIHLDPRTRENYFSARVALGTTLAGSPHYCMLHFYGGQRGSAFICTHMGAYMYGGVWPNAAVFATQDNSDCSSTRS